MLDFLRKKAGSLMIKFILGAIIVVFVFWGVGSFRERDFAAIATVNGEQIPLETYRETYNNLLEQVRQRFGDNLNDDILKALDLRQQALDRLIDQALWAQEAVRLGFQVSDEEVAAAISRTPAFQNAGVFDPRRYQAVLSQYRMTPESFEALQKESMLVEKLRMLIASGVTVSENEIEEWYNWNNASVKIDYVLFESGTRQDIDATAEEIQQFYEENKDSYKSGPQVKVRYVMFSPEDYRDGVTISEEAIGAYYESNPEDFTTAGTVEARHILLKVDPSASEDTVAARRAEAELIAAKARAGEDFAELAKTHSEGPTRDSGGYLGEFRREDMVKPFSDAAFELAAGKVSEPVRTQFGWHVIKVEKVNPAEKRTLDEVREEIRTILAGNESRDKAYDDAAEFYDSTLDGEDLSKTVGDRPVEVRSTAFFDAAGPAGVSDRDAFAQAAFKLEAGDISGIEELGDGFYIIQAVEKLPARIQDLAQVEEAVASDLIEKKRQEAAAAAAGKFLEQVKAGGSLQAQSAEEGLAVATTGFFKRNSAIPGLGPEPDINQAAFRLSEDNPLPDKPVKGSKGYYVIRLNEKKAPDAAELETQKASLKNELIRRKQMSALDAWLAKLKAGSRIDIQEGFLE